MQARRLKGWQAHIITSFAVISCCYALLHFSSILPRLGYSFQPMPHRAMYFGFVLSLIFLLFPATEKAQKDRLPWYDIALAILSLLPTWYVGICWPSVWEHMGMSSPTIIEIIFGFLLVLLVLEGTRRVVGWIFPAIALFFVIHPLLANHFPWIFHARGYSFKRVIGHMYLYGDGMLSTPMQAAATVVVAFILFGQILSVTGAGRHFTDLALSIFGVIRGGTAKASVIASGLFGMICGSSVANVGVTGVITIPLMKGSGFSARFAAGVEAVASNGGQLMPPVMGAVAFIMSEMTGLSYSRICISSFLPALLYYIILLTQVDLESARMGIKGVPKSELPSFKTALKEGWLYFIPLVLMVYLLIILNYPPDMCAFWAIVALVVLASIRKSSRLGFPKFITAFNDTARVMCMVASACACAGIIIGSIGLTGVGIKLSSGLIEISGGSLPLLLVLTAAASFILGMGMTSIPCYLVVAVLVAPALVEAGIPIMAAHLFAFWLGLASFITPPVAIMAYAAAGIAGANPMQAGMQSVRLGICIFIVPFFFCFSPELLLMGTAGSVALTFITSALGAIMIGIGLEGYLFRALPLPWRGLLFLAGLIMILPGWLTDLAGIVLGVLVIIFQIKFRGQPAQPV